MIPRERERKINAGNTIAQLSAQRHISDHVAGSRILKTTSGSCRAEFQKGACYTENDGPFEP